MRHFLLASVFLSVLPYSAGAATVRASVGRPLQQAEALIQKHEYQAALKKTQQASAVGGLTPYESTVIAEVRGEAAAGAGDYAQAANAYQAVLASGSVPKATQLQLIQAVSGFYYRAKDYPNAVAWVNRYIGAGGEDSQTRALLAQSYYQEADYRHAEQAVLEAQKVAQSTDQALTEGQLQILADSAQKLGDLEGYTRALDALLMAYPNRRYWAEAIVSLAAQSGFPDRLALDVYRLRRATGTLTAAGDYEDYAERAILVGQPVEAKSVIDEGFSYGILTDATDSGHAERLKTLAWKDAQADTQGLSTRVEQAKASEDANVLTATGIDLVDQGQPSQGMDLIQSGVEKGGLDHPEEDLNLGIVYLTANSKDDAIRSFQKVIVDSESSNQQSPEAALARLWLIYAQSSEIRK
jgi:tetratricopeptide (TPR) repeat protein